jgi:hypothetical protein
MTARRDVQSMLGEYLDAQKRKATNMERLLGSFREKRDRLLADKTQVRIRARPCRHDMLLQVYKHFDSLPDLSSLPVDRPLPSAGELFQ